MNMSKTLTGFSEVKQRILKEVSKGNNTSKVISDALGKDRELVCVILLRCYRQGLVDRDKKHIEESKKPIYEYIITERGKKRLEYYVSSEEQVKGVASKELKPYFRVIAKNMKEIEAILKVLATEENEKNRAKQIAVIHEFNDNTLENLKIIRDLKVNLELQY